MSEQRIEMTIHIARPPAVVFAAWQTAEAFASWFAPMASMRPNVVMDFRVDGRYKVEMPMPDGSVHTTEGTFHKITRGREIVMSWRCDAFPDPESIVTVTFQASGAGTDIHLTHEPFENASTCDSHLGGWQACLANLAAVLQRA